MPRPDLLPVVDRFDGLHVCVVGDFIADEYIFATAERLSREAPVSVARFERAVLGAGGAGNVARNVVALGATCSAIGLVGVDDVGSRMLAALDASSVNLGGVFRDPHYETPRKTRILVSAGGALHQQIARVDRSGVRDRRTPSGFLTGSVQVFDGDALIVSDYGEGTMGGAIVRRVLEQAAKLPVFVDARRDLTRYKGVAAIKPNEEELLSWAQLDRHAPGHVFAEAVAQLGVACSAKAVLCTQGELGAWLASVEGPDGHIHAVGREGAIDTTGAGDTTIAALALARTAGASWSDAATLAMYAAGVAVAHRGAYAVTAAELRTALETW